jgi:hypothetical protein
MINVVNKHYHKPTTNDIYIGRPSSLGNPFTHLNTKSKAEVKVNSREEAIEKYKEWITKKIKEKDPAVIQELTNIITIAEHNDVNLVCWCHPKACHGHILKKIIDNYFINKIK